MVIGTLQKNYEMVKEGKQHRRKSIYRKIELISRKLNVDVFYIKGSSEFATIYSRNYIFLHENHSEEKHWQYFAYFVGVMINKENDINFQLSAKEFSYDFCIPKSIIFEKVTYRELTNPSKKIISFIANEFCVEEEFARERINHLII